MPQCLHHFRSNIRFSHRRNSPGLRFISTVDLKSAYYQIPVDKALQFLPPQTASRIFQRLKTQEMLAGFLCGFLAVYLDDVKVLNPQSTTSHNVREASTSQTSLRNPGTRIPRPHSLSTQKQATTHAPGGPKTRKSI